MHTHVGLAGTASLKFWSPSRRATFSWPSSLTRSASRAVHADPSRKADGAGGPVPRAPRDGVCSRAARLICARRTKSGAWPGVAAPPPSHQLRLVVSRPRFLGDFFHVSRAGLSETREAGGLEADPGGGGGRWSGGADAGRPTEESSPGRGRRQGPRHGQWTGRGLQARPVDGAEHPWGTNLRRGPKDGSEARFHTGRSSASAP